MSTETEQFTSPVDTAPPDDGNKGPFTSPDSDMRLDQSGRELKKSPGFSGSLDKSIKKTEEAKPAADAKKSEETKKASDPIAAKNAEEKKEEKKEEPKSRSSRLLADDDKDDKPAKAEKREVKKEEKVDELTEADIEDELKAQHSEKSNRRFREMNSRWKAAEKLAAERTTALAERDKKLAEVEAQIKEQSEKMAKAVQPDAELQKKLDQLEMYQRRFDLENSDYVKNTYDARITRSEENIYTTLQTAGIKFKGMDEKQSVDLIKKQGGFRGFARANPELTESILDALPLIDKKSVEAAVTSQIQLEQEKAHYITTESSKAKDFFEKQRKEVEAARANEVTPEKRKELQKAAIEKLTNEMYGKYAFFKDVEVPGDASTEERERLTGDNTFAKEMRETLASHLRPANDEEFIDTALAATLAHKFKRDNVALNREVKQLRADLERMKNGSKTSGRGGALPSTTPDKSSQKPAASFGAALDRQAERRGGNL